MKIFEVVVEGLKNPKDNPCWKGYKPVGTKKKAGKKVPNCVPVEECTTSGSIATVATPLGATQRRNPSVYKKAKKPYANSKE